MIRILSASLIFFARVILSSSLIEISSKVKLTTIINRGRGIVATEVIRAGELLIKEAPVLTLSVHDKWFRPTDSYQLGVLDRQFLQLDPKQQQDVLDLYSFYSDDLLGRFQTNAYPTSHRMQQRASLFPTISRINSECYANVHFNYNPQSNHATVYAIRDIEVDEEILNCYIGPYQSRDDRQEYLFSKFGFRCTCRVCSLTDSALISSDRHRLRLKELTDEIEGLLKRTSIVDSEQASGLDFESLDDCAAFRDNSIIFRLALEMLEHHILVVHPAEGACRQTTDSAIYELMTAVRISTNKLGARTQPSSTFKVSAIDEGIANNAIHIYDCCKYAYIAADRQVTMLSKSTDERLLTLTNEWHQLKNLWRKHLLAFMRICKGDDAKELMHLLEE